MGLTVTSKKHDESVIKLEQDAKVFFSDNMFKYIRTNMHQIFTTYVKKNEIKHP